jgi:osmotically-inducible protein OsmY
MWVPYCLAVSVMVPLAACDQTQENRAAQGAAKAVHQGNQALRELKDKTEQGGRQAATAMREGTRELKAELSDAAITGKVKAALLADPAVEGSRIDVDTRAAVVTLTGQLADAAQAQRAAELARGVSGVKDVESRLTSAEKR